MSGKGFIAEEPNRSEGSCAASGMSVGRMDRKASRSVLNAGRRIPKHANGRFVNMYLGKATPDDPVARPAQLGR